MAFNPDQFLAETAPKGFDPDAFLASTAPKAEPDLKSALFPRTAAGAEGEAGYGRQVLNAGADLLSLPGRYAASLGNAQTAQSNAHFKSDLADTKGSTLIGGILRSPATAAGILTAPLAAPVMAMAGLPALGAAGAGAGAKIAQGAVMGLQQGLSGGLATQAENAGAGNGFSGKQLGADVAIGAATGGALPAAGAALKGAGQKILGSILRPSIALEKSGFGPQELATLGKRGAQAAFDLKLDAPSLEGMAEKTTAKLSELGQAHKQAIAMGEAAGNEVDPYASLEKTFQKIKANPKIYKGPLRDLEKAKSVLADELDQLHEYAGLNPKSRAAQPTSESLADAAQRAAAAKGKAQSLASIANNDNAFASSGASHAEDMAGMAGRFGQKVQGEKGFFAWSHEETLANAKQAAERAKDAALTAEARSAAGTIAKKDADAAQRAAVAAAKNHATLDAADQIAKGAQLQDVAKNIIRDHEITGKDLESVLSKARDKAPEFAKPPAPSAGMGLQGVQDWKSRLGGMADWDGSDYGPAVKKLAKLANQDLDRAIDKAAPGIGEINDQLHKALSVKEALEARLPVHMRNNAVTLGHMGAFVAGGAPGTAAYLATKSPLAASAAYRLGDLMRPSQAASIGTNAATRSLASLMRQRNQ